MDKIAKDDPLPSVEGAHPIARGGILGRLRESAVRALPETILVLVLGNVLVGLVGGIWRKMAPTPPPGMGPNSFSGAGQSLSRFVHWPSIKEHQFLIVYLIFLLHSLRVRLFTKASAAGQEVGSHLFSPPRTFWHGWCRLVVGNGFGALFSALALVWVQRFSPSQLLWHNLLQPMLAQLRGVLVHFFGESLAGGIQNWAGWYGENQFRFTFWLLYLGAICDDFGVPNFKTLGAWLWRKLRARFRAGRCGRSIDIL